MKKYLRRIAFQTESQRFHPLTWVFVFMTFVWGFMFVFLPGSQAVSATMIFQLTAEYLPGLSWLPNLFGIANLVTVVSMFIALMFRNLRLGPAVGMTGFLTWMFALGLYLVEGLWIAAFSIALPLAFFWGFFFLATKRYRNNVYAGLASPPK